MDYPLPNFWEGISHFILHLAGHVITYPSIKGGPGRRTYLQVVLLLLPVNNWQRYIV